MKKNIQILFLLSFFWSLQASAAKPGTLYNPKDPKVRKFLRALEPENISMPVEQQIVRIVDVVKEIVDLTKLQIHTLTEQKLLTRAQEEQERLARVAKLSQQMPKVPQQAQLAKVSSCPIRVVTIPVLGQGDHPWPSGNIENTAISWNKVAQGEGGNCGYHALKNVFGMLQLLAEVGQSGGPLDLQRFAEFEFYRKFMQRAIPIIAEFKVRGNDLSWLDAGQLQVLVKRQTYPVLVVEHIPRFGFTKEVLFPLRQFVQNDQGILGFIWNSGRRESLSQMGGVHWVGFVAVKNTNVRGCSITLYHMDSMASNMFVEEVKKFLSLTTAEIDAILRRHEISDMQGYMETFKHPKRTQPTTLQDVVDVILINWKDYQLPVEIQLSILQVLENKLAEMTFEERCIQLSKDENLLNSLKRLDLVDQSRVHALLPDLYQVFLAHFNVG